LQYNDTFILPDLSITAPKCGNVSSDLNVPFKLPAQKKRLLKVSLKTVKKWKNGRQISPRAFLSIAPLKEKKLLFLWKKILFLSITIFIPDLLPLQTKIIVFCVKY
jgi:hypothetical protein